MEDKPKKVSRIAKLVNDRLNELSGVKSQRDIAEIVGYANQNMITMIKQGTAKVALDRVPLLAKALEIDPVHLMRLAMEQFYTPKTAASLMELFSQVMTRNEADIIETIRRASDDTDPKLTDEMRAELIRFFS